MNKDIINRRLAILAMGSPLLIGRSFASWLEPNHLYASNLPKIMLDRDLPTLFGGWSASQDGTGKIVSPSLVESLSEAYDQTISRVYISNSNSPIKLALAYGENQRKKKIHLPEGCYKAQGFAVTNSSLKRIRINDVNLYVGAFIATPTVGSSEIVFYWLCYGGVSATGKLGWRYELFEQQAKGDIPDGLLFRISVDINKTEENFKSAAENTLFNFAKQAYAALPVDVRYRYFPRS